MAKKDNGVGHGSPGRTNDRSEYLETVGLALEGLERYATPSAGDVVLVGMGVRLSGDALVTLKAVIAREKRVVAFVGGATLAGAILKAEWLLRTGTVEWRSDKFGEQFVQKRETV